MRFPARQADCGSCWAFGSVEAMTDRICIASKGQKKIHLSAEDVTSCDNMGDMGCNGGIPSTAPGSVRWVFYLFLQEEEDFVYDPKRVFHPEKGAWSYCFSESGSNARCTPTTRPSELWMAAIMVTNPCAIPISWSLAPITAPPRSTPTALVARPPPSARASAWTTGPTGDPASITAAVATACASRVTASAVMPWCRKFTRMGQSPACSSCIKVSFLGGFKVFCLKHAFFRSIWIHLGWLSAIG